MCALLITVLMFVCVYYQREKDLNTLCDQHEPSGLPQNKICFNNETYVKSLTSKTPGLLIGHLVLNTSYTARLCGNPKKCNFGLNIPLSVNTTQLQSSVGANGTNHFSNAAKDKSKEYTLKGDASVDMYLYHRNACLPPLQTRMPYSVLVNY